jgi:hypothetical protein
MDNRRINSPLRPASAMWRGVIGLFVAFRLLTAAWATAVVLIAPPNISPSDPELPNYQELVLERGPVGRALLGAWYRWDTAHYITLAMHGYAPDDGTTSWPPLMSLLTAALTVLLKDPLISILVISNAALIAALALLYVYVADHDESLAVWTLALWLAWPMGFYLFAGYAESLFAACVLGALLAARRGRWLVAGLCGALAALTRTPGVLIGLPLAVAFWEEHRGLVLRKWWRAAFIGLIPAAYGAYAVYVARWVGGGWPWEVVARRWHFRSAWPWEGLIGNAQALFGLVPTDYPFPFSLALDTGAVLLFAGLMVVATRRLSRMDAVYGWSLLALYLTTVYDRPMPIMSSTSRYVLTLFPGFVALASLARKPWQRVALTSGLLVLQLIALALFVERVWVT